MNDSLEQVRTAIQQLCNKADNGVKVNIVTTLGIGDHLLLIKGPKKVGLVIFQNEFSDEEVMIAKVNRALEFIDEPTLDEEEDETDDDE